jgi:AbrB family looped-hinge helix DNA binding protein
METTRLSTKGQVIIPKNIRSSRDWRPGTELVIEETVDGVLLRDADRFPKSELGDVAGCLPYRGKRKSLAQMHRAVASEVRRRSDRGRY